MYKEKAGRQYRNGATSTVLTATPVDNHPRRRYGIEYDDPLAGLDALDILAKLVLAPRARLNLEPKLTRMT